MEKRFLDLLTQYVGFRTVSLPGHIEPEQINKCLAFLIAFFGRAGIRVEMWESEKLNPILFAHYTVDKNLPTVLVYGHYDVVAVNPKEWTITQPFQLKEQDGMLYGRGATDNKGQNLVHIFTVAELIKAGKLACNVKFFIEGNEETGSAGIEKVIEEHKEELRADYFLVSDGEMIGTTPVIELSLRGLANVRVKVRTATKDNHSGLAGGAIYNSVVEASKLICSLYDEDGKIAVPGFDLALPRHLLQSTYVSINNAKLSNKVNLKEVLGVNLLSEPDNPFTAIGLMPTIEVMGITAGGAHEGYKHIIPGETSFGLNLRLVGQQDPKVMTKEVMRHLINHAPGYVELQMEDYAHHPPIMISLSKEISQHTKLLLEKAYGEESLEKYTGGGIPVVGHFIDIVGVKPLLIPLANDTCNMHGVHENIGVSFVEKALAFSELFFSTPLPR